MNDNFVILLVLDGWGIAPPGSGNAITLATTTNINRLNYSFPNTTLRASEEAVGLPRGEVGNTETGHLNLGAGRIVYQDLARINLSIDDGTFFENKVLIGAIEHAVKNNSNLHLMGLIGAGGVHSNLDHLFALLHLTNIRKFNRVFLHLFTDGRDSPPTSSALYISQVRQIIKKEQVGVIASVMGRYWAMDRDQRWDRTEKAYNALTLAEGKYVKTPEEAIEASYEEGKTDEFLTPSIIVKDDGKPVATINDNDAVIFFNFRIDRPRQLTKVFVAKDFQNSSTEWGYDPFTVKYQKKHEIHDTKARSTFIRKKYINNLYFATMTEYSKILVEDGAKVAIHPELVTMTLGRVIAENGLKQLRMAESEKERFVTFYFNGQQNVKLIGEDVIIIPSPNVSTYDQKPEMSVYQLTEKLLEELKKANNYSFVLVNFANADMVGHTGSLGPAVKACEAIDECVGKIASHVLGYGGNLIITADHGNTEEMINLQSGQINTEHSINPVPFICVSKKFIGQPLKLTQGILSDVAPTILHLLGLDIPDTMTGRNLLEEID